MTNFGKSFVKKGENIKKAFKTLQVAKGDADRYMADKATKALGRLKGNSIKKGSEHLVF